MDNVDDPGCAVRSDGTLKDASEIEWQYDKDNKSPMVAPSSPEMTKASASSSKGPGIASFFLKKATPAVVVAGSHRSSRMVRPSAHALDPDNAMTGQISSSKPAAARAREGTSHKRKSSSLALSRRVSRKVITSDDEDDFLELEELRDDEGGETEVIESEPDTSEGVTSEFESLQAMADADHQVSTLLISRSELG